MKLGKIYTFENASEAKKLVGKRVIVGNCLAEIASDCLESIVDHISNRNRCILTGIEEEDFYPFWVMAGTSLGERFQFIREIIEEEKDKPKLMTNRQLAEWLAKGFGEHTYEGENSYSYNCWDYHLMLENNSVSDDVRIRSWDSDEWVKPTVDVYERDCK